MWLEAKGLHGLGHDRVWCAMSRSVLWAASTQCSLCESPFSEDVE